MGTQRTEAHSESDSSTASLARQVRRVTRARPGNLETLSAGLDIAATRGRRSKMVDYMFEVSAERDKRSLSEVLDRHRVDFGVDTRGVQLMPPSIPMCRLVHMEVVRTIQKASDSIEQLRESFLQNGYSPDIGAKFYVQPTDMEGKPIFVDDEVRSRWDPLWVEQDKQFVADCEAEPTFHILKDRMFSVFDGNHRLFSWTKVTEENPMNPKYHPRVTCVIFKGDLSSMVELELAMHSVNK